MPPGSVWQWYGQPPCLLAVPACRLVAAPCRRDGRERILTDLKRVSKPGRRVYARKDRLPRVLGGMGTAILSTSTGLVTARTAQQKGIGGEVICFVW